MIYIITNSFNPIACGVIDWLNFYDLKFERINDYIKEFNKIDFCLGSNKDNEHFYWINRVRSDEPDNVDHQVYCQLLHEYHQGFFKNLNSRNVLGQALYVSDLNKFKVLEIAESLEIKIPKTIITNKKSHVLEFISNHRLIITKSCHDIFNINIDNRLFRPYTSLLNDDNVSSLNDVFGISMFQENIKKICDIKAFYLNGKFYPQAIFSQANHDTKIDFRLYSKEKASRITPFKLPKDLEKKTKKLLESLSLNIAVVDFMLSTNYELYFLEINTDGVFDGISVMCNYNLDKKIANYLYERKKGQNQI